MKMIFGLFEDDLPADRPKVLEHPGITIYEVAKPAAFRKSRRFIPLENRLSVECSTLIEFLTVFCDSLLVLEFLTGLIISPFHSSIFSILFNSFEVTRLYSAFGFGELALVTGVLNPLVQNLPHPVQCLLMLLRVREVVYLVRVGLDIVKFLIRFPGCHEQGL